MKRVFRLLLICAGLCLLLVVSVGAVDFTFGEGTMFYTIRSGSSISSGSGRFTYGNSGTLLFSQYNSSGNTVYNFTPLRLNFNGPSGPIDAGQVITMSGGLPYYYLAAAATTDFATPGSNEPYEINIYLTDYVTGKTFKAYTLTESDYSLSKVNSGTAYKHYSVNTYATFKLDRPVLPSGYVEIVYKSFNIAPKKVSMKISYISPTTLKIGSSAPSASEAISNATQTIVSTLEKETQLNRQQLIWIQQYSASLYEFFTNPAVENGTGTTYVYNWNEYVAGTIKFMAAFNSQNLTTHNKLTAIDNAIDDLFISLGYSPLTSMDPGWNTLKESLKTMNVAIIASIENGVTDIIDHMETSYADVDTGEISGTTSDTNTIISNSDKVESNLMQSATSAMGDINLDTPNIGSQTLSAMVALLPYYNGFFTASGEVGLVLVFSLAVGIVLLLIGRRGQAAITRVSRNRGDDE